MGDHLVLHVENLVKREVSEQSVDKSSSGAGAVVPRGAITSDKRMEEHEGPEEEEPLIQTMECRICQEEDHIEKLESPCACSGSLKFAHRKCVQRWCNEKGNVICEICHQPYQPGYTAPTPSPSPPPRPGETTVDISEGWTFPGGPMDAHDPRLLAIAAAERHFLEADYDEYTSTDTNGAAFLRSAALILMALLLLRHALTMTGADSDDDDASTIFSLFLLRAVGFLLPCYIMAWAVSILQQRRQSEDATALAAAEVAFVLQSGQPGGGLQFTIAPAPVRTTIHQSPGLVNDTPRNG